MKAVPQMLEDRVAELRSAVYALQASLAFGVYPLSLPQCVAALELLLGFRSVATRVSVRAECCPQKLSFPTCMACASLVSACSEKSEFA